MFNKRPAKAKADDANPVKAKVVKLTPAELLANEHPRKIMIIIKSTGFYKFKPEDGDRLTEIACIETLHGEPTGQAFHAFIRLEDAALQAKHFEYCRATLKQKKKTTEGELLCQNLSEARPFSEVQPALLAFLQRNPETTILTHPKGYILDFLRHAMDKAGNEQLVILQNSMIDMRSKAAALSHLGLYKYQDHRR